MSSITNVKSFAEAGKYVEKLVDEKNREVVYDIWKEVVSWTPVCSGKAAASWFVSPGIPVTKDRIPNPPWRSGDDCVRIYDDPTLSITSHKQLLGKYKKNYKNWFISNPVDYIQSLNSGSSVKAPVGFVETAISRALSRHR